MAGTRNLCAPIPLALHEKVCEERDKAGLTNGPYITALLMEYYEWKENGGKDMARENGKTRTMAFQISEELFKRIKEYLDRESKRLGYKITQKDFVIGLVEKALNEAEEALAADSGTADASISEDPKGLDGATGESPVEPEDKTSEAPMNPEGEASEAPTEPESDDGGTPAETQDAASEDPNEGSQQEDGETGGDDTETHTAENG